MVSATYTIKDVLGIHARPAGRLVTKVKEFDAVLKLQAGAKSADLKKILSVMLLGAKQGTKLTITAEGTDEQEALAAVKEFFEQNL